MSKRLTRGEMKSIIKLYEAGTDIKEIRERTGRSYDAIKKVLGETGLDENWVDHESWRYAEREYQGTNPNTFMAWTKCPVDTRVELFNKFKPLVQKECKAYYDSIMSSKDISDDEAKTEAYKESIKPAMTIAEAIEQLRGNDIDEAIQLAIAALERQQDIDVQVRTLYGMAKTVFLKNSYPEFIDYCRIMVLAKMEDSIHPGWHTTKCQELDFMSATIHQKKEDEADA